MIPRILHLLVLALAIAFALPPRAFAQLSISGKLMTYRTVDSDSGEEVNRTRSWQAIDGRAPVEVTATTFPIGTKVLKACAFANGIARPATSFRSVMLSANGELERSDFDTLDPAYYPFLAQPVTADMQPGSCLNKSAFDLPKVMSGEQVTKWTWSDSGLVGVIFQGDGAEKLTVAAGTFDAMRVRADVDLSKLFPRVPALFLKLVKPHFTIWITRAEPYYVLKMVGFDSDSGPQHPHTFVELVSIADLAATAPPDATRRETETVPAELAQADTAGADQHPTRVNSGSFAQGDRTGRVTLATAATPEGELLVTHVGFSNGLATESRTLIDHRAAPVTAYLDDRSFNAAGAMMRKHLLYFRKAAFPADPAKDLPPDLYGGDTTLGLVLPRLLPTGADEASFHVMDFYGQVNQLTISEVGEGSVALASDEAPAIHAKLKPIVDVPFLLRPLAYFFIPSFDAYFAADPSHRLLKFEGPLGPPGVPTATMVADQTVPLPSPAAPLASTGH